MAGTGVPATSILHFNPHVNWRTAKNVAIQCKMPPTVIEADIFQYPEVVVNLANRCYYYCFATVYKGNIIKNLIMDCQSYAKYRPNETTGGIFVSWRRKEELPTGA